MSSTIKSSRFLKTIDGQWINVNNVLELWIRERDLEYGEKEPHRFCIAAAFLYSGHVFYRELYIKDDQKSWTREEWQDYLDNFMYEQGLFNGEEY